MRIPTEPVVARLVRRLLQALATAPLGRPDAVEAVHWYAIWQGDAFAD